MAVKEKKKSIYSELKNKKDKGERQFSTLNASRWSFGFQMFRGHIAKMIIMNIILLISAIPLFIILLSRYSQLLHATTISPFSINIGIGYMPYTQLTGLEASIAKTVNQNFFMYFPLTLIPIGIALSGVLYVMRNLFWLEDVHVLKDFITGVKKNYLVVLYTFIFGLLVSVCAYAIIFSNYQSAMSGRQWYNILTNIICYVAIVFFTLMYLNGSVMSVTYKVSFFGLIKNSFLVSVILCVVHALILVVALVPFILLKFGGFFIYLAIALIAFVGCSYFVLVWTNYSHWIYEKFLPAPQPSPEMLKAKENAKREEEREGLKEEINFALPVKPIKDDDFKVASLPLVYTLSDVLDVELNREQMRKDSDDYLAQNTIQAEEGVEIVSSEDTQTKKKKSSKKRK